jgi:hypothetical protein
MLSVVKGIQPRDQVEAMLAAQMAAVHMASIKFAGRIVRRGDARISLSRQPRYRSLAHVEPSGQIGLRRAAVGKRCQSLPPLVFRQLRRPAHVNAASVSSLSPLPSSSPN